MYTLLLQTFGIAVNQIRLKWGYWGGKRWCDLLLPHFNSDSLIYVSSERRLRTPTNPNIFHEREYPLTLHFFEDSYGKELQDGEEIGVQTLGDTVKLPSGYLEIGYLYWMIGPDGEGSVHSFGRKLQ